MSRQQLSRMLQRIADGWQHSRVAKEFLPASPDQYETKEEDPTVTEPASTGGQRAGEPER